MTKELSSFSNLNITLVYYLIILTTLICLPISSTDAQLAEYVQMYWFATAPAASVQELLEFHPQDPTQGSPYDTGDLNELSSQLKRIASFQGDAAFQAPRRFFLRQRFYHQNTWAFCESDSGTSSVVSSLIFYPVSKRLKSVPILGSVSCVSTRRYPIIPTFFVFQFHGSDLYNVYGGDDMTSYLVRFVTNLDPNGAPGTLSWPRWTTSSPNLLTFLDRADAIAFMIIMNLEYVR